MFGQNTDALRSAHASQKIDSADLQLRYSIGESTLNFRIGYWDSLYNDAVLIGHKIIASAALNNLGFINNDLGDIAKALEYHHKSLRLREEIADKPGIALSLNNIGYVYNSQGDAVKALEYHHKSMQIRKELNDQIGVAYSLNNIGSIYKDQGLTSKALNYFEEALKIGEQTSDKIGIGNSLNNIGDIYKIQGNNKLALDYFQKSLSVRQKAGDNRGIAISLGNVADQMLKTGNVQMALDHANQGMKLSKKLGFPQLIKYSANILKLIFQKQNKYKEAFEMYELEVKMRDSIHNEETQKAAVRKQLQYVYETQARELRNGQDKKDIIAKEELKQKEKERNYFIIGFALVIILAIFIFRSYRQKQKANITISRQKHEVEESRKEILDSIRYAKRIQKAHMPSEKYIDKNINRLQKKD